jgi:hypothetical protein
VTQTLGVASDIESRIVVVVFGGVLSAPPDLGRLRHRRGALALSSGHGAVFALTSALGDCPYVEVSQLVFILDRLLLRKISWRRVVV